ncbi:MAG: N-acetyltransferase family protein [Lautropia sp.]
MTPRRRHAAVTPRRAYPPHWVAPARFGDATSGLIRPIARSDFGRHLRFLAGLSLQTRYQRLMSARRLGRDELIRLVDIDYRREVALIAVVSDDPVDDAAPATGGRVIGVGRYVRGAGSGAAGDTDPDTADFAMVVADQWQHRGVGVQLLERLLAIAADERVDCVTGLTLATNQDMLRLARRFGFAIAPERGDWTLRRLSIVPSERRRPGG